jgi:hypothetical protein
MYYSRYAESLSKLMFNNSELEWYSIRRFCTNIQVQMRLLLWLFERNCHVITRTIGFEMLSLKNHVNPSNNKF